MILVIDNYDSFIYNIVQYVGEFHGDIRVFRNDRITLDKALSMGPDAIIISPGPGRPEDSKVSLDLIKSGTDIPVLGVCLGHQGIAYAFGGEIVGARSIRHGKVSAVTHNGQGIFEGVRNPLKATRYHSLVANREGLPDCLEITAESEDGEIMGLKVRDKDIYGVQFHPESILTEDGKTILKNFTNLALKKSEVRHNDKAAGRVKALISQAGERRDLTLEEAREMAGYFMTGNATPSQVAAYLMALRMKGETSDEITGSALAMFEACVRISPNVAPLVDTCGSGGDKTGTFNISTAAAFVAAGAGCFVAKHGNRSITSQSGSADVLEQLGVNIQLSPDAVKACIEDAGIGFIFAPLYHPAMKFVMPTRREIGVRTLFNILGPIVNPAGVKHHVMGVFSRELLDLVPPVFLKLGHKHSLVIHGEIGIDEASIEGRTLVREIRNGTIKEFAIDPSEFGLDGKIASLKVKSPDESADTIRRVLSGREKGDARKAVVLNAGLAISVTRDCTLAEAFQAAQESIDSGRAHQALERLIQMTQLRK